MNWEAVANEAVNEYGAAQQASELAGALQLAESLQPSVVVEIGCLTGGTLYAWRQACERVYGITLLAHHKYIGGREQKLLAHGAVIRFGDSHDPKSREWLEYELDGSPVDMLVIDADHKFDDVKQDLMMYGPLVRPGGIILIHDVLLAPPVFHDQEFEVWRLWEHLEKMYETSIIGTEVGWGVIRVRAEDEFGHELAETTFS
jgi:cephalosporin hydroxylase